MHGVPGMKHGSAAQGPSTPPSGHTSHLDIQEVAAAERPDESSKGILAVICKELYTLRAWSAGKHRRQAKCYRRKEYVLSLMRTTHELIANHLV